MQLRKKCNNNKKHEQWSQIPLDSMWQRRNLRPYLLLGMHSVLTDFGLLILIPALRPHQCTSPPAASCSSRIISSFIQPQFKVSETSEAPACKQAHASSPCRTFPHSSSRAFPELRAHPSQSLRTRSAYCAKLKSACILNS